MPKGKRGFQKGHTINNGRPGWLKGKKGYTNAGSFKPNSKPWNWKGGIKKDSGGYILIHKPDHPFCNNHGYVFQHRLVMEEFLGKLLNPEERVHHINGIRNDNRIENLKLFNNQSNHLSSNPHKYGIFVYKGREKQYNTEYNRIWRTNKTNNN